MRYDDLFDEGIRRIRKVGWSDTSTWEPDAFPESAQPRIHGLAGLRDAILDSREASLETSSSALR
jgi:hypothetical protein